MQQPNMLYYGPSKPQYPLKLDHLQKWGDFTNERRNIRRDQERERLGKHFEHRGNYGRSYPAPQSLYRNVGLNQGERYYISQVKAATRGALGPSFDFDDESYSRSQNHADTYQRSRNWTDYKEYEVNDIPQKYIDEFNQKWHEYDEDNDADQILADYAKEAPWRKHVPSAYPVGRHTRARATTVTPRMAKRTDSGYGSVTSDRRPETSYRPTPSRRNAYRTELPQTSHRAENSRRAEATERPRTPVPGLVSTFSWEERDKKRKGGFFSELFHRH